MKIKNVYDEVSNKGYFVGDGDILYTPQEMKKMLDESQLTTAQMGVIYALNHDAAIGEMKKMLDHFDEIPEVRIGEFCRDELYTTRRSELLFKVLAVIQLGILIVALAACLVTGFPLKHYFMFVGLMFLSYILSYGFIICLKSLIHDSVDEFIQDSIETPEREKMWSLINSRKQIVYKIQNTYLMYKTIADRISDPTKDDFDDLK